MISLFSSTVRLVPRLTCALTGEQVVRAGSWDEMLRCAGGSDCSVVLVESLLRGRDFEELMRFSDSHAQHPVVLVTRDDPENARCLASVTVEEVLWIREIDEQLAAAVRRARTGRRFARLAAQIDRAQRLPLRLRNALCAACLARRPPRSVCRLAALAGCHRSTLWLQWRQVCDARRDGAALRLEDFLDWLLLLAAVQRKSPRLSWAEVAHEVGVHEHTVARLARRLAGRTLRGVENRGGVLLDHFAGTVLPRVLGTSDEASPSRDGVKEAAEMELAFAAD